MVIDVSSAPKRLARPVRRAVDTPPRRAHLIIGALLTAALLATGFGLAAGSLGHLVAYGFLLPVVVGAGLFLTVQQMKLVFAFVLVCGLAMFSFQHPARLVYLVALVGVMVLLLAVASTRSAAGVSQSMGTSMLCDLRERMQIQASLPQLPAGWHVESSVRAAHGESFAGDFVVGTCPSSDHFEMVLADVSGNGAAAGTRSLLTAGAFAGLLGAMEPSRYLPAANEYLLRQRWAEGFATAIHAHVDLATGEYTVGSAGHPAAMHFHAGCGRWSAVQGASGVLLGVLEKQGADDYPRSAGRLQRGDALLFYSDGMVESSGADIMQGLDRMLGHADRAVATGLSGAAGRICAAACSGENDDRTVVLLWRD